MYTILLPIATRVRNLRKEKPLSVSPFRPAYLVLPIHSGTRVPCFELIIHQSQGDVNTFSKKIFLFFSVLCPNFLFSILLRREAVDFFNA